MSTLIKDRLVSALRRLNVSEGRTCLKDEGALDVLRGTDDEESLDWHIVRYSLPESDGLEGVSEFRDRLALGNKILGLLGEHGFFIEGIGQDYPDYALTGLHIIHEWDKDIRRPTYGADGNRQDSVIS